MAYRISLNLALGSGQTGLTLKAQLFDMVGADVGSEVTAGFIERGAGNYFWDYDGFPDGFRGGVDFYVGTHVPANVKAVIGVDPAEVERVINTEADVLGVSTNTVTLLVEAESAAENLAILQGDVTALTADVAGVPAVVDSTLSGTHGSGAWTSDESGSDPFENTVEDYVSPQLGWVLGQLVGPPAISSVAPVLTDSGDLQLAKGQDYMRQEGNPITFSNTGDWPQLPNAAVKFLAFNLELDMDVTQTGATQIVQMDLDGDVTEGLQLSRYRYRIVANLPTGDRTVLAAGRVILT